MYTELSIFSRNKSWISSLPNVLETVHYYEILPLWRPEDYAASFGTSGTLVSHRPWTYSGWAVCWLGTYSPHGLPQSAVPAHSHRPRY